MALSLSRLLSLGGLVFILSLSVSCDKSEGTCATTAQCALGFTCSAEGKCESFDASADAAAACPELTHYCAAPVPADWSGPVVGTRAGVGETLADCGGQYAADASVVGEGVTAEGECSCACPGDAGTITCSNATIREQDTCAVCGPIETCDEMTVLGDGVCRLVSGTLSDGDNLKIFLGTVQSTGTCAAPQESNTLASSFASYERYCAAEPLVASCPESGACLPSAVDPAFDASCIYQAGDHDCPAAYPAKEVRYIAIEDGRACSACTCSEPAMGTSCGGTLSYGAGDCSSTADVTANSCQNNPIFPNGSTGVRYVPNPDNTCAQAGAEETGEAVGTGETTFCCTEAIPDPS